MVGRRRRGGRRGDVAYYLGAVVVVSGGKRWRGVPLTWLGSPLLGLPLVLPPRVVLCASRSSDGGGSGPVGLVGGWRLAAAVVAAVAAVATATAGGDGSGEGRGTGGVGGGKEVRDDVSNTPS